MTNQWAAAFWIRGGRSSGQSSDVSGSVKQRCSKGSGPLQLQTSHWSCCRPRCRT